MSIDLRARLRVPATARKGEVVEIKTLITHPMESGQRRDATGKLVARRIVNRLSVRYAGRPVLDARFEPAIAANPFFGFFLRVEQAGTLEFVWTDDDGASYRAEQKIALSG